MSNGSVAFIVLMAAVLLLAILLPSDPRVRDQSLLLAFVAGVIIWFLVLAVPVNFGTIGAQILILAARMLWGPTELRQFLSIVLLMVLQFGGALAVLYAYAIGLRLARVPATDQSRRVRLIRSVIFALTPMFWTWRAPQFMAGGAGGLELELIVSTGVMGLAYGIWLARSGSSVKIPLASLALVPALALLGLGLSDRADTLPILLLPAGISTLCTVFIVGQLVEMGTREIRAKNGGGMLPVMLLGFVTGVLIGR